MSKTVKLLVTVGRPEFLPANSASLILGVSWGLSLPVDFIWGLAIPLVLAFAAITLVAAFAAHINTLSDYELDVKDETKKKLVEAMGQLGAQKLKRFMALELSLSLALLLLLVVLQSKPALLLMWAAAVFLAYAYSAPPLRLKSRSFFAPITLMIVLSILPVTFVTYVFTTTLVFYFWIFLAGQAITVYAVIVPAEIRDYFGDKAKGVLTMTVQLGLRNASLLGLALLGLGGALCGVGFGLALWASSLPILAVFLVIMAAAYLLILSKYVVLFKLSRDLAKPEPLKIEQGIVELAAQNPKWITLITQSLVVMSLVLLVSKLI
jgi:1,4-dihydroxy-2-naphthoate polyprenyltransferase